MYQSELAQNGFSSVKSVYSLSEINKIQNVISDWVLNNEGNEVSKDVFSIRRLLEKIPELKFHLFTPNLKRIINELGSMDTFLVKAIYFDKPEGFNWFVSYHQDLSITVDEKHPVEGYTKWTFKQGQVGVIPPKEVLENVFTIRIHLDDTDDENGALRIIPKSHLKGIRRVEDIEIEKSLEVLCPIEKGSVMLMKPLTFHASSKSKMNNRRRVIHLEFSDIELNDPLKWREKEIL